MDRNNFLPLIPEKNVEVTLSIKQKLELLNRLHLTWALAAMGARHPYFRIKQSQAAVRG